MTSIDPGVTLPQGTAALASGSTGSGGVGPSATLGTANGTRAADPAAPPPPNLLAASLPAQAQEDREVSAATCEPAQPRELSLMEKVQGAQERLAFAESHAALANVPSRVSELLREIQTLDTEFAEKSARLKIVRVSSLASATRNFTAQLTGRFHCELHANSYLPMPPPSPITHTHHTHTHIRTPSHA